MEEAGIDGGGIFREFITDLLKTAFDPNRGFFILTKDNKLYPNPNVATVYPNFTSHYFFIGRMLAKVMHFFKEFFRRSGYYESWQISCEEHYVYCKILSGGILLGLR